MIVIVTPELTPYGIRATLGMYRTGAYTWCTLLILV